MTNAEIEKRIERLFNTYEYKKKRLAQAYDRLWDNAGTSTEILEVNDWYTKEQDKIAAWWSKSIRDLSEETKV